MIDKANNTVFVGTDVGVFFQKNGKKNWKSVGVGLPNVPVLDIQLQVQTNTLFASTFGRSMYSVDLSQ